MSEGTTKSGGKLSLNKGKLTLSKTVESGQVRQSFSHGRSKTVIVETKSRRSFDRAEQGDANTAAKGGPARRPVAENSKLVSDNPLDGLSEAERQARIRALETAQKDEERRKREAEESERRAEEARRRKAEEEEARRKAEEQAAATGDSEAAAEPVSEPETVIPDPTELPPPPSEKPDAARARAKTETPPPAADDKDKKKSATMRLRGEPRRRQGKLTISQALEDEDGESRTRSLAALRRAREREKQQNRERLSRGEKVVREVTVPEAITVGELANRMAERAPDVIKRLMGMGVMATVNQALDADTAELVVEEFGHRAKRVSEADVEDVLIKPAPEDQGDAGPRAPVVTVMGHVGHGKTSLLDALRATDVVAGEAGGITQHIGAYQVTLSSGDQITFLDTPGHAAFTSMRQRGAQVTDIVVLVIAADDGIQPQTVEAINHAKAAEVPIIVAINKIDKEGADPNRAKTQLLEHELVPEDMGGDVICVEVSALKKTGLDTLEETILLQAEILELTAVENAPARGAVVEAKLEKGRGSVATVLIQHGTLQVGDIFVAGQEWGRVRALLNDKGQQVKEAGPSVPVEVLGLQGTPHAGDEFIVLQDEGRAREIAEYRQRKARDQQATVSARGTLEQMFEKVKAGEAEQLPVVVKTDVQGSLEAITAALDKLATDEVKVRVLHGAVGGVTESDVTLASSTGGVILGFNVRANPQARELAKRDGVDIRYYSIIYDLIDDMKSVLSGMLAPEEREEFLGYAEIREVFAITKVGKVAGCMVTDGEVRRGAKVRLLRDDTVIYEGALKQLKRFKDDVREVKQGYECGMAFENYDDIKEGDVVECFDVQSVKREL
jgi:translation initiation factor IF-2